jgi:hypothetical protein
VKRPGSPGTGASTPEPSTVPEADRAASHETAAKPASVADPAPVGKPTPVTDPVSVGRPAPVADPAPVAKPAPVTDPGPAPARTTESGRPSEVGGDAASGTALEAARADTPEATPAPAGRSTLDKILEEDAEPELQARWSGIQAGFVDSPKRAVEEADKLVADVTARVAEAIRVRQELLREGWQKTAPDTEEYRLVLQEYRAFVGRLVEI